jgi:hypothetical protein
MRMGQLRPDPNLLRQGEARRDEVALHDYTDKGYASRSIQADR